MKKLELFNHDTEETIIVNFNEFLEWFNENDDIYTVKKVKFNNESNKINNSEATK